MNVVDRRAMPIKRTIIPEASDVSISQRGLCYKTDKKGY